ncbi:MAG: hypothetical protein IJU93_01865 [Lachnospiraceae bacterium]|nr:hypothetical protein [Lachnospiraceae bacterium]
MSEWQFSKSKFEERHINDDLWEVDERQRMNDDKYEKAFGYDLVSGNLKLKADDLSTEKIFGQQLEKRSLIDKDLLKSKIEQKYNEAFGNKTIWKLTKGKRADHAQNKLRLQDHMREEYETLIEKRNAESQDRMDYISVDMANQLALNYYTNDEKAVRR